MARRRTSRRTATVSIFARAPWVRQALYVCGMVLLLGTVTGCVGAKPRAIVAYPNEVTVHELSAAPIRPAERRDIVALPLQRSQTALAQRIFVYGAETLHKHVDHDLIVFLASGKGVIRLGAQSFPMRAGDVVFIERGVVHAFRNTDHQGSLALVISVPPARPDDRVELQPPH